MEHAISFGSKVLNGSSGMNKTKPKSDISIPIWEKRRYVKHICK